MTKKKPTIGAKEKQHNQTMNNQNTTLNTERSGERKQEKNVRWKIGQSLS